MKVVFFGTPYFAAEILKYLVENNIDICAVVTQKDAFNRKAIIPEVKKEAAEILDVPIFQPHKASDPAFIEELRKFNADLFIVVAYGQILKKELLDIPRKDAINVHASILPKYRGAAPIERAIWEGEEKTGITIMKMVAKLDAGDIIATDEVYIDPDMTSKELKQKLLEIAKPLLLETIHLFEKDQISYEKQDDKYSTYAHKIEKEDLLLDFNKDAKSLHNQIRALSPSPGARVEILLNGVKKYLKILKSKIIDQKSEPKKIICFEKDNFIIGCNGQALQILELQLEGKRAMNASDFIKGVKNKIEII